ncbi:hypothetical protein AMATHDRAFT_1710 [Amanita thiersii Skay4041]|uniref:Protein kinase domain-containing protein n=1 Tax=Amanita thiersii Skay4041 TaxID=703135 RepID=A0A2A9NYR4_9AGAR|nr:hypothetical protein AMATHDRAFT_1710 [Amanita thiersii Skay4041]
MAPPRGPADDKERDRQRFKARLAKALTEEDDPLAVYYQFVQWTIKHYGERDPKSGLAQLLEEATRVFREDPLYKTDLRYLKLSSLYARQLPRSDAISIYASLLSNKIGTSYSVLYEEYANLLEQDGRRTEADAIYCKGISCNARPLERLKTRYRDFQNRKGSSAPSASSSATIASSSKSQHPSTVVALTSVNSTAQQRYAIMLAPPAPGKRPEKLCFNLSLLFNDGVEYSIQEARAKSMGLLGKKWAPLQTSNQPPFSSSSSVSFAQSDETQKSTRFGGASKRKSLMYGGASEPTVTINTKEALADVLGMYNSPDKTRSIGLPGSKHAPLKKVEPITPMPQPRFTTHSNENNNENAQPQSAKTPSAAFRPFVDENAKPDRAVSTSAKFKPYVDSDASKAPVVLSSRPVLKLQETSFTPSSRLSGSQSPAETQSAYSSATPSQTVFSKVFTPVERRAPQLAPLREVFTDDLGKPQPKPKPLTHERARSHGTLSPPSNSDVLPSSSSSKTTFRSPADNDNARTAFKVFSRPPEQESAQQAPTQEHQAGSDGPRGGLGRENPFTPKIPSSSSSPFSSDVKTSAFTPYSDEPKVTASTPSAPFKPFVDPENKENAPSASSSVFAKPRPVLKESQPRPVLVPSLGWPSSAVSSSSSSSFSDFADIPEQGNVLLPEQYDDDYQYEEDEFEDGDEEQQSVQHHIPEDDSEYEYERETFQDAQHHHHYRDQEDVPLGGRFGRINVMTPITERTLEYTMMSNRGETPSDRLQRIQSGGDDDDYEMGHAGECGEDENANILVYQHRNEVDAVRAAERLAAELRAEETEESGHRAHARRDHEDRSGVFNLADTLTLSSKFKPPNPCNPFSTNILSILLSRIPSDPHFYDLRDQESGMLEPLQKFAKKAGRKSGGDIPEFTLGLNGKRFSVSEKLGEGGFGSVFKARDMGSRQSNEDDESEEDDFDDDFDDGATYVALKLVNPCNLWEYHVLRRLHSALPPAARRSVVLPHALYAYKDESILVLDLCPQGTLLTTVNGAVAAGVSQQGGCLDELLVMFFSIELLRLVEAMHSVGFIHGDLKIDNCLLRLEDVPGGVSAWSGAYQPSGEGGWACKGLRIIDFGRMIDTRLFPAEQEYTAEWETDERDCFEVREGRPWTYQTDYFGLAGIVYCLLFGKYIQTSAVVAVPDGSSASNESSLRPRYKIGTPFKRYWQTEIWTRLFDILLNPTLIRSSEKLPLCDELAAVRREMETWLQANCNRSSNTLKGLLKKVEMASLR